jgi:hypothetical protein
MKFIAWFNSSRRRRWAVGRKKPFWELGMEQETLEDDKIRRKFSAPCFLVNHVQT